LVYIEGIRITHMATATKSSSSTEAGNEFTSRNLELFACLWLDQNVDSTQDNLDTQQELRRIINHLRTFDNSDKCEQYIRQITKERVILIVSGTLGREIVPRLHELSQCSVFYIFCRDKKRNEQWANKYHKVRQTA
jgi:hypothetical protein